MEDKYLKEAIKALNEFKAFYPKNFIANIEKENEVEFAEKKAEGLLLVGERFPSGTTGIDTVNVTVKIAKNTIEDMRNWMAEANKFVTETKKDDNKSSKKEIKILLEKIATVIYSVYGYIETVTDYIKENNQRELFYLKISTLLLESHASEANYITLQKKLDDLKGIAKNWKNVSDRINSDAKLKNTEDFDEISKHIEKKEKESRIKLEILNAENKMRKSEQVRIFNQYVDAILELNSYKISGTYKALPIQQFKNKDMLSVKQYALSKLPNTFRDKMRQDAYLDYFYVGSSTLDELNVAFAAIGGEDALTQEQFDNYRTAIMGLTKKSKSQKKIVTKKKKVKKEWRVSYAFVDWIGDSYIGILIMLGVLAAFVGLFFLFDNVEMYFPGEWMMKHEIDFLDVWESPDGIITFLFSLIILVVYSIADVFIALWWVIARVFGAIYWLIITLIPAAIAGGSIFLCVLLFEDCDRKPTGVILSIIIALGAIALYALMIICKVGIWIEF